MLYHLLYPLHTHFSFFNVFRYITFRCIYATITALLICFIFGPYLIKRLKVHQIGQAIRKDGPASHLKKEGTPTMGGLLILISIIVPTLLWANLTNRYIWMTLFVTVCFGLLGFVDDYLKVSRRNSKGVPARSKILVQVLVAAVCTFILMRVQGFPTTVVFPFFKNFSPDIGNFYLLLGIFVIVGTSNAVNLTDGLDGLAIGPTMISAATYTLFAYLAGHAIISRYLNIPYVKGVGELSIFCGSMVGASMGFLWFNTYPAQVFMGDTGSLSLGGALGTIALMTKQELLLIIVGGIFVIETLSVIIQVASYKLTGKRVFKMAPIHHHYELKGWAEPKIIVRFWIISIFLGLIAISTLKIR
ncbi:MAG: phospho-N-acetylmuramoyl-pentapeptide-transferase [Deltaproteobacteria bacterium]|nr:phospho-N-acetylmuramoyl-pentapeptide-transferase [Deltaproteobacteria bacterium]